jgi:hypothetical protein
MMAAFRGTPGGTGLENHMRKGALLLALVLAVGVTTTASAAKKKPRAAVDPAVAAQQDTARLLNDMFFHPWAPTPEPKMKKTKKKKAS